MTTKELTPGHLIKFREHYGLTQQQAADLAGVTRVTWNRYERNYSPVPPYMVHVLRSLAWKLNKKKED